MSTVLKTLAVLAPLVSLAAAHGEVVAVQANGQYKQAPNIYYAADSRNSDTPVSTMYDAGGKAYALPSDFGDASAMSCESASIPPGTLTVTSGSTLRFYWEGASGELDGQAGVGSYVGSHAWVHAMGTVAIDIASCDGDCSSADPASLKWNRILYDGYDTTQTISDGLKQSMSNKPEPYYPTSGTGLWGMASLIQRGSWVEATIPQDLVAGSYMSRVELAAVHSPGAPQLYIGCARIAVEGSGTKSLTGGTIASQLYSTSGALATVDVYSGSFSFSGDGPALLDFATQTSSGSSSSSSGSSSSDNSSSDSSDSSSGSEDDGSYEDDGSKDVSDESSSSSDAPAETSSTYEAPAETSSSEAAPAATTSSEAATSTGASTCRRRRRSLSGEKAKRVVKMHKRSSFPHVHSL
ncbi:lytic polysaccharide monooxygenase [Cylindrobasidium torrendii FP15055 ss-10]|uniref:Lytic polysaccharide monooxygenase n=1 Tax=Cylindrobasidium torrendii FP15055 ss-10 TaxID=1314674 RepID=A0A0D7BFJ6_9AGAR|nr:lytic polysaccharide monooxygenase [Cylindrobasidium torrendii FP15055 ss-10]